MRLILHQALKDARLLRWLLAAWVLLLCATHAVTIGASRADSIDPDTLNRLATLETTFVVLATAIFIVVAALLVQQDSPVSANAFWLTRPVSRPAMLLSKLLLALVVLVALPLLLDAVDFVAAGLTLRWFPPAAVVFQLAWLLPVMAIAAITIGLPRFLLIAVFEIVLFIGMAGLGSSLGIRSPRSPVPVLTAAMAVLGVALLVHLYLTRRVRSSAAFFGLAPVVLCAALALAPRAVTEWPWGDEADYPDAGQAGISVALDRSAIAAMPFSGGLTIQAPLTITGLPPDSEVFVSAREWLQSGSEKVVLRGAGSRFLGGIEAMGDQLLKNALAGTTLLNPGAITYSRPSITIWVPGPELARFKDRPVTLGANVFLGVYRYREAGALVSLQAGASFDTRGAHTDVLAVRPVNHLLTVAVRRTASAGFGFLAPRDHLLRNRRLGLSVVGGLGEQRRFGTVSSSQEIMRMLMPVPLHESVVWADLQFNLAPPNRRTEEQQAASLRADDWLRDGELVVITRPLVGQWRVIVSLPKVVLSQIPTRSPMPEASR